MAPLADLLIKHALPMATPIITIIIGFTLSRCSIGASWAGGKITQLIKAPPPIAPNVRIDVE